MFTVTRAYSARPIRLLGVRSRGEGGAGAEPGVSPPDGWRIKAYSIVAGEASSFDLARFGGGVQQAMAALPMPAVTRERPGVGFLILHQGFGDYTVLAWWDRENELPLRVFVRDDPAGAAPGAGSRWRPARGAESICVWDLQVIALEREAYVKHVLAKTGVAAAAIDDYLAARA